MNFDTRWQRIMDCVRLARPDRMPVVMYATFWLAKYGGISYRQLMYDYEASAEIAERAVREFEPDACAPLFTGAALGRVFEAVDFKQLQWPGSEKRLGSVYGFVEICVRRRAG